MKNDVITYGFTKEQLSLLREFMQEEYELTTAECVIGDLQWESQVSQEKPTIEQIEKTSPEALLNEVLSEVFS